MMSINGREQETLDSIEDGLARAAPKLAAMMAMFSRLTADEEMPVREPLRRAARGLVTGAGTAAGLVSSGRTRGRRIGRKTWRWLWLAVAVALVVVTLTLSHGTGGSTCTALRNTACGQAPAPGHPGVGRPDRPGSAG